MGRYVNPVVAGDDYSVIAAVALAGMRQAVYYATLVSEGGGVWHIAFFQDAELSQPAGLTASFDADGVVAANNEYLGGSLTVANVATLEADAEITITFTWRDTGAGPGSMGGGMSSPPGEM